MPFSLVICAIAFTNNLKGQSTYYSTHASPSSGNEYDYSFGGICIGCYVASPSNAATMSMTDSTHLYMTVGALNSISAQLELTDTANSTFGVVISRNTGLLNLSALNAITLRTYKGGVLKETFNGGSLLSLSLINGSKQSVWANASQTFDVVEIEIDNALGALWDFNIFYAFGTYVTPLPVKLISFNAKTPQPTTVNLNWQVADEENCKGYTIMHSVDGKSFNKLMTLPAKNLNEELSTYDFSHQLIATGRAYYYLLIEEMNGEMSKSATVTVDGRVAINTNPLVNYYPNPVTDNLTLTLNEPLTGLAIYNHLGQVVYQEQSEAGSAIHVIDLKDLVTGLYYLKIENAEGQSSIIQFSKL